MSVQIQTVEFERREAHLSDEDEAPWTVHGVALGAGDVTVGQSGIKKLWPDEELAAAAETLEGTNLVVDHENDSLGVVGEVTKAGYKDGVGVIYEAELFDEDLADKIGNGLLEVSIRGHHASVEELDVDDETEAKIVEDITFENLSIVPTGAADSNTIEMGEAEELSVAQLAEFTAELQEEEEEEDESDDESDDEIEAGSYVQWGDKYGIVLSMPEDGEVEVDVYEENDGEFTPVGETETLAVGDLSPWDVDEENIGPMEDDESEEESSEEEASERVEGEEEQVESDADKERIKDQSPERFPEGGTDDDNCDELQEYSFHEPEWSGTTESDWSSPDMEDFDTDDLSEIADHFLISTSGFPPENFSDLKLPVVEPNGDLNKSALAAVKGGRGAPAVENLSENMENEIIDWVNDTANEEFDESWGDDEEEAMRHGLPKQEERRRTIDDTGMEEGVRDTGPVGVSLDMIAKYLRIEGNHERDSVDNMLSWLFGSTDVPSETLEDFRMAATTFINETADTDSFDVVTVEQFYGWLSMQDNRSSRRVSDSSGGRGGLSQSTAPVTVLTGDDFQRRGKSGESESDSLTTYKVNNMTEEIEEELNELDEPVAVEKSDLDELQNKADQFEEMNSSLEDLRERTEILDDVDREQVEELAESEEPVVLESARHEQLQDEAEQVKNVYAAALAEAYDIFDADELTDRFSIEELRSKFEDNIGDPAEELAADPKSGDPDEEELEEQAQKEESEELSEDEKKAAEKQEELREKILNGGR